MNNYVMASSLLACFIPNICPADSADASEDHKVTVTAQRLQYRSLSATGATKTDALLKDLPQSVTVLTPALLQDAGVSNLAGALDLSSGVSRQSDLGGLWDSYAMRGFTGDPNFGSDYMVNGFSSSRGYNGRRDLAATHSIEVLKGPASALYGRGEPGGTVNIITKKPRFAQEASIDTSIGSFDRYRQAVDLTGPLGETLAYRVNAAYQSAHSFRDTLKSTSSLVAPSFLWLPNARTTVSYEIEDAKQKAPFDRGVLAIGGQLGRLPPSRFLGEPGDGRISIDSLGQQLFVQHELGENWSVQSGLSYRDSSLRGFSTEANNLLADGRSLRRQRRYRDFSATDRSVRLELLGKLSVFGVGHNLLFGVDSYRFDDSRLQLRRNPSATNAYAIDIFAPVYGGTTDPLPLSVNTLERQRANGLYFQDQLDLSQRWKALLGVRYDRYSQSVENRRLNLLNAQKLQASSPRIGLVYQPLPTTSLYVSAARGYRPNSGISVDNQAFAAEKSLAYETGIKLETPDGKLSGTLAVYDIRKNNVLTVNPANTDFSVAAGEVASRGVELDVSGALTRTLRVAASYAYTDAEVSRGDKLILTGSRLPNVARQSASLMLVKAFRIGESDASLGAGLKYVGERAGDVAASSGFTLPAYTVARLSASYAPLPRLRVVLSVDNLFDKVYYTSSYSQMWVTPGAERALSLNLHYGF